MKALIIIMTFIGIAIVANGLIEGKHVSLVANCLTILSILGGWYYIWKKVVFHGKDWKATQKGRDILARESALQLREKIINKKGLGLTGKREYLYQWYSFQAGIKLYIEEK